MLEALMKVFEDVLVLLPAMGPLTPPPEAGSGHLGREEDPPPPPLLLPGQAPPPLGRGRRRARPPQHPPSHPNCRSARRAERRSPPPSEKIRRREDVERRLGLRLEVKQRFITVLLQGPSSTATWPWAAPSFHGHVTRVRRSEVRSCSILSTVLPIKPLIITIIAASGFNKLAADLRVELTSAHCPVG